MTKKKTDRKNTGNAQPTRKATEDPRGNVLKRLESIVTENDDRLLALVRKYEDAIQEATTQADASAMGNIASILNHYVPSYVALQRMLYSGLQLELRVCNESATVPEETSK